MSSAILLLGWALVTAPFPFGAGGDDPVAPPLQPATAHPDSVRAHLVASVEEALGWVGAAEAVLVSGSSIEGTPLAERDLASDRADLLRLLDQMARAGAWAGPELVRLRALHPESLILLRALAFWHMEGGDLEAAEPLLLQLLERRPRDGALHRAWARLHLERGEGEEARMALERALELEPESEATFRSLLALHEEAGTLPALAARMARLRRLHPDLAVLVERERELAHRIDRARAPARDGV